MTDDISHCRRVRRVRPDDGRLRIDNARKAVAGAIKADMRHGVLHNEQFAIHFNHAGCVMKAFLGIFLGLTVGVLVDVGVAQAHDPETGQANWITEGAYASPQTGVHCCGPHDCDRLDQAEVKATPRGFVLHAFKDELVPYSEATPSEDGKYWRCHTAIINGLDGSRSGGERRCFFAPVGTE